MLRVYVAGLLMAAGLSTPSLALAQGAGEIGRIKTVTGTATVVRGKAATPAAPGYQLLVSDVLATGPNGRIGVTFIDNSRFAVGPNSRVSVSQFRYDRTRQQGEFVTSVDRGSLAIVSGKIAKSKRDAMKVRTPTSLLGVRGTKFIVEVAK